MKTIGPLALAFATLPVLAIVATGCQQRTCAQADIDRGWVVFGTSLPTERGVDPEVTVETLGPFVDADQFVVLSATVSDVCRTMGCWLEVEGDSGERLFVMNRDHAFFIPRNATGRRVHLMGWAYTDEQSVDFQRHIAMDAGKSPEEIEAIVEPRTRRMFIANAVILPPGGLEAPVRPLQAETELPATDTSMVPAPAPDATPATEAAGGPADTAPGNDASLEDLP